MRVSLYRFLVGRERLYHRTKCETMAADKHQKNLEYSLCGKNLTFRLERVEEQNFPELITAFRDLAATASQPRDSFLYEYLHERGGQAHLSLAFGTRWRV